jgi:hypothetical protein
MDTFIPASLMPSLYGWLCIAVLACALVMPKGLIAVDRLLAKQPAPSEWTDWSHVPRGMNAMRAPLWPRVLTAAGAALLFAALLTLMFLCGQLAL